MPLMKIDMIKRAKSGRNHKNSRYFIPGDVGGVWCS